jgi:hypothetical protein
MKIDTFIDIVRMRRKVDGKNPNYARLINTLCVYRKMYEVETISEIIDTEHFEYKWLRRVPNGGRKSLNLFKELLTELKFWDYYFMGKE